MEVPEDRGLNSSKSLNSLNLSPSKITSNKLHHNYTLTHKYKNNKDSSKSVYEEWIKKTKLPLAMYMSEGNGVRKKLEEVSFTVFVRATYVMGMICNFA